jgi:hypothetical protein
MPSNTYNLGKDCTVVLIAPTGAQINLSIVESFEAKQTVHSLTVRPLNGPPQFAHLPDGWTGSFMIERASSAADDLFSQIEQGYWAGGSFGTGQVFQYVTEVNGSTSTYQFDGVAMHLSEAGSWKADSSVKQTIQFAASTRKRV